MHKNSLVPSTDFNRTKMRRLVPLLLLVLIMDWGCQGPELDLKDMVGVLSRKLNILSRMQISLLRSVEAEKNAVMAETDAESQSFAEKSIKAADSVDRDRREIGGLMDKDHSNQELQLLQEFDGCWAEFRKTDQVLLDYAVKNHNLKAARLSFGPAREAVNRLEIALNRLTPADPKNRAEERIPRLTCRALTAALKTHDLQAPHIAAADDLQMDTIEAAIKKHQEEIKDSLKTLKALGSPDKEADWQEARTAFDDLVKVTGQVIDFSRQNTNIKSFELSLGRKRKISAQCGEILVSLEEAVKAREFKATR
jgi:hypothetical protein